MTSAFIVLEGGDGVGKSTQAVAVAAALRDRGHTVVLTREPGGTSLGNTVRDIVLNTALAPKAEALLFAAARAEHVATVIRPALERGEVVVCDRYIDSSVAYQGMARRLGTQWIRELSCWAADGLEPDRTILLDLDPQQGLDRAQDPNRMEAEGLAFQADVRESFLNSAEDSLYHHVVDAGGDVNEITALIVHLIERPVDA